ncbi:hypothetical protein GGI35DRAFT_228519 [Trichoderma velutinum]
MNMAKTENEAPNHGGFPWSVLDARPWKQLGVVKGGDRAEFGAHVLSYTGAKNGVARQNKPGKEKKNEREGKEKPKNKGPVPKGSRLFFVLELRFAYAYPGSVRDRACKKERALFFFSLLLLSVGGVFSCFPGCREKKNTKKTYDKGPRPHFHKARVPLLDGRRNFLIPSLLSWLHFIPHPVCTV